jgi:hypothetical protein
MSSGRTLAADLTKGILGNRFEHILIFCLLLVWSSDSRDSLGYTGVYFCGQVRTPAPLPGWGYLSRGAAQPMSKSQATTQSSDKARR